MKTAPLIQTFASQMLLLGLAVTQLTANEPQQPSPATELPHAADAEQPADAGATTSATAALDPRQKRYQQFAEQLSGVKLIGRFTILGQDAPPREEEYTINNVVKMPAGDYWLFSARIKYGDKDYTVPLPLKVKWADDTPMITLTRLTIAGQGPFSARVIFYNEKYAGTWSHGDVGGHMYGRIVKIEDAASPAEDASRSSP